MVTGGADGVGEVGEPSGDARDGTEAAGEIAAVAVAQVIAADEAVIGKRGAVGGEGCLGAGVVDGADEVGVGGVDVFAPLRFHGAGVVLVLLGVEDELLLHPRKFQVVDGGDAHIAHDVASDVSGAEIFAVELVVVRIDGAAGEVGRKVAVDRAASGGAPRVEFLLVKITREQEVEVIADVVFGIEGDRVVVIFGGAIGAVKLEGFRDDVGVDGGEVAASAAAHGVGAEEGAVGGHVDVASGVGERGDGAERVGVDEEALGIYAGALGVLGHEADGGFAERTVGERAVHAAEIAADVVHPGVVVLLDGGDAEGEFVVEAAVEVEFGAQEVVAADHEFYAGEVFGEEAAFGDLVAGAAEVGFAVEKGVGAAEDFDAFGGVGFHRGIPDPAVAHGVVVHDATKDAFVGQRGVRVSFAGDEPFGHFVEVGRADVLDELRVDDGDGVGDVFEILHGAHAGGRLHGFVAEVLLFGDGECGQGNRLGFFGGGIGGLSGAGAGGGGLGLGRDGDDHTKG